MFVFITKELKYKPMENSAYLILNHLLLKLSFKVVSQAFLQRFSMFYTVVLATDKYIISCLNLILLWQCNELFNIMY